MTLFLASALIALLVSFICSLMEASVLSMTPSQVADLTARHPRVGVIWQGFKTNIEKPIAVILILNTTAHTVGATIAGSQFDTLYGDEWVWVFSLIFTYVMLQFTEILPKTLGVRYNRELAVVFARPLAVMIRVSTPFIRFIHLINRPFERRGSQSQTPATLEEISALAGLARLSNQIGSHQERIIKGASKLSKMQVSQVMIPVEQVAFLSTDQSLPEAIVTAHIDSHTRFPVCEAGDRDKVLGYVNFKEMIYFMRTNPNDATLKGIIRPVHFVSPDGSAADLLKVFVEQHVHMAIVRDTQETSVGLVTFEDLVEELVGDIEDEFDRLPRMFHSLSGGTWMVGGGVSMAELVQRLNLPLGGVQGNVAAWLGAKFEDVPKPGQIYRDVEHEFMVRRVRRGKVFEASVMRVTP